MVVHSNANTLLPEGLFISDNMSGAHPEVLQAITDTNKNRASPYGDDPHTKMCVKKFKELLGQNIDVYFVTNGSAANTLSIHNFLSTYHSVICTEMAHINQFECGAIEATVGCKVLPVPSLDGKLNVNSINSHLVHLGDFKCSQPKMISITQPTELGTVYSIEELNKLKAFAKENNLLLHMDGARLANACSHLKTTLKQMTNGFDVITFGATKNGAIMADAVIFLNSQASRNFKYIQKQNLQLISKHSFISSQFLSIFHKNLWLKNADNANKMAQLLVEKLASIPYTKVLYPVEANIVFVKFPTELIETIEHHVSLVDVQNGIVRLVTSFDTKAIDINSFIQMIQSNMKQKDIYEKHLSSQ